jgi:hypothetical protein
VMLASSLVGMREKRDWNPVDNFCDSGGLR